MKKLAVVFLLSGIALGATIYFGMEFRSLEREIVAIRGAQAVQMGYLNKLEIRLRDRDAEVDGRIDDVHDIITSEKIRLNRLMRLHPIQAMEDNSKK